MMYDPHKHHRRSIRLKGYDYSQDGLYFVTICVKNGLCLFGDVVDGNMILNSAGIMVSREWQKLSDRFPQAKLDVFQVMPNHFHAILGIHNPPVGAGLVPAQDTVPAQDDASDCNRATTRGAPTGVVLGNMVGAFKSITTHEYISGVNKDGWEPFPGKLWQRNYYEHIIRNERALNAIREYIQDNPANWGADKLHPNAPPNTFNQSW